MSGTSLLTGTKTTFKDSTCSESTAFAFVRVLFWSSQDLHAAGAPFVLGGMRSCGVRTEDRADPPHKDETLGSMDR